MITLLLAAALLTPDVTCRVRNSDGKLVRSISRRNAFLRSLGYPNQPPVGYCVDHIVPLVCGGCDVGSNMALMLCTEMRVKDDRMKVRSKQPLCNVPMGPLLPEPLNLIVTPPPPPKKKGE